MSRDVIQVIVVTAMFAMLPGNVPFRSLLAAVALQMVRHGDFWPWFFKFHA